MDFLDYHQLITIIELLGTAAFAVSGALMAMQYKLDMIGIFTAAFVTAVGGGTLRDILLGAEVFWIDDYLIYIVVFLSTVLAIVIRKKNKKYHKPLFFFDSIGLGLFTITGVEKGIIYEHPFIFCIILGVMTGCVGGIMRDVLVNHIPVVLRKEIYITACIIGGIVHYVLLQFINIDPLIILGVTMVIIVGVRYIAEAKKLNLPNFSTDD